MKGNLLFFKIFRFFKDTGGTIPFYEKLGFKRHHIIENFFIDNYSKPIYECGVKLVHMVYLQKNLKIERENYGL